MDFYANLRKMFNIFKYFFRAKTLFNLQNNLQIPNLIFEFSF